MPLAFKYSTSRSARSSSVGNRFPSRSYQYSSKGCFTQATLQTPPDSELAKLLLVPAAGAQVLLAVPPVLFAAVPARLVGAPARQSHQGWKLALLRG